MRHIEYDAKRGVVIIDGLETSGFVDDSLCPNCGVAQLFAYDYDAYFCPECNVWLEEACDDPDCEFCYNRPENPIKLISR